MTPAERDVIVSTGGKTATLPGGFTFQVSEFVKLVVVLLAARYLSEMKGDRPSLRDLFKLGALVALPMALVMKQPDLGTALTYSAITGAAVFFAGLRWQHAAVIGLILVLILPLSWTVGLLAHTA